MGGVKISDFSYSSSLDANCRRVLDVLAKEHLAEFSFDGMRKKTGMHQEMLSRTLERLHEHSLVVRTSTGYGVSNEFAVTEIEALNQHSPEQELIPLAQTLLPRDIDIDDVIHALQRKWFSNLRWLGHSIIGEKAILKWLTEDNQVQIEATFSDGSVQIQARSETSQLNRTIIAANHLLAFIVRIYEKQPRASM